jgi:hypothetical protein
MELAQVIDAALGRKSQALEEGRRAIAITPLGKDVTNGSRVIQFFAITAAWSGERELALQQLQAGLRAPDAAQVLSYGALKLLPFWEPLRGDPRFEKIVASFAPKNDLEGPFTTHHSLRNVDPSTAIRCTEIRASGNLLRDPVGQKLGGVRVVMDRYRGVGLYFNSSRFLTGPA